MEWISWGNPKLYGNYPLGNPPQMGLLSGVIAFFWGYYPLCNPVFFFSVKLFVCPWNFSKKCPWNYEKCPWQKTPNFARETWLVARDKFAKKVPVKNEKCPWQFQILNLKKQKVPVTHQWFFYPNFFDHQLKLPFFTSWEKFIGHSFIQNPKIYFFCTKKGGKNSFFFVNQEKSSLNSFKVWLCFNYCIKK